MWLLQIQSVYNEGTTVLIRRITLRQGIQYGVVLKNGHLTAILMGRLVPCTIFVECTLSSNKKDCSYEMFQDDSSLLLLRNIVKKVNTEDNNNDSINSWFCHSAFSSLLL